MGFKLGNINCEKGIVLAPMAGYTDRAMRLLCHELGAELTVTEMVSAKAVCYSDKKTEILARIKEDEVPVSVQIFGSEPEICAEAAGKLSKGYGEGYAKPCAIDVNMGCPVNKIFSNGEGSALMRNPDLIYRIVRAVSGAVDIPVSVKIRAGVDAEHINATECALAAEEGGAKLIAVHGRTRTQMYGGKADLEIIKNVKKSVHIPLIANGDIKSAEDAMRAFSYTGCDGVMIGRGAVGNPFVFREICAAMEGGDYVLPTLNERKEVALRQLHLAILDKGEAVAVREARKQIALYFGGFRGSSRLRMMINTATTYDEVLSAMSEVCD